MLIRADDLGFSEGINCGIARSVKSGLVRSVGIMTNMPTAEEGVEMLKGTEVCFGQHTNICAGRPLTDPKKIPSLVQSNGEFRPSKEYRAAYKEGKDFVNLDEVVLEIEAQYQQFKKLTGEEPHYFEGHAVASKNFFKGLKIVAERHDLPLLEFSLEPFAFRGHRMRTQMKSMDPDYDPEKFIREVADHCEDDFVDMVVCHPGYLDAYILKHSSLTMPRPMEVEMLCDPEVRKYIENKGIQLITYDDLK